MFSKLNFKNTLKYFSTSKSELNFAVLLSGCGVYDGSEITEAVSILIALSKNKIKYQCFSLNKDVESVDHISGKDLTNKRNILQESARISRGNIKDIKDLNIKQYDALVLPGGFGAAKNLSTWAKEGEKFTVDKSVEKTIKEFHNNKKPIAACCVSPVILGKIFGTKNQGPSAKITLGNEGSKEDWPYSDSIKTIENLGNKLERCNVDQITEDSQNLLITTPAYMNGTATPYEVYTGIDKMIEQTIKMINKKI